MKSYKKKYVESRKDIIITLLFTSFVLMLSVGYAVMNTTFNISGEAVVRPIENIRITGISEYGVNNGGIVEYNATYTKNTITTSSKLPNLNSEVKYVIEITNIGNAGMRVKDICDLVNNICLESDENKNAYIDYEFSNYISEIEEGKIQDVDTFVIAPGESKNIVITFKYKDNITEVPTDESNQIISSSIKFSFVRLISILAEGSDASSDSTFFNGTLAKKNVKTITFEPTVEIPDGNNIVSWDASRNRDNNVIAWYVNDNSGLYDLHIGGYGYVAPYNGEKLFYNFTNLESIIFGVDDENANEYVPYFRTDSILSSDGTVQLKGSITSLGNMFIGCNSLKELDLRSFNTNSISNMKRMFYNCSNLKSIEFGENFNTSNVKSMYFMFNNCNSLTSLNLSNFNTTNVTDMTNMFNNCSSLTSLNLNSFSSDNLKTTRGMFTDCTLLVDISLGKNFTVNKVTDMTYMFTRCSSLKSLDLSNFIGGNVTSLLQMFEDCKALESIDFGLFTPKSNTNVNMKSMFNNCNSLTSLNLSNFNTTSVTDMTNMFSNCNSLTSLNLSNFNTTSVTGMAYMFSNCNSLTTLVLSNDFDTQNVTNMKRMFYNCRLLEEINLKGFNTSKVTDMTYMFYYCNSLTSLDLSNFNTTNVTDMTYMFYSTTTNLKNIDFSNLGEPYNSEYNPTVTNILRHTTAVNNLMLKNVSKESYNKTYLQTILNLLPNGANVYVKDSDCTNVLNELMTSGVITKTLNVVDCSSNSCDFASLSISET